MEMLGQGLSDQMAGLPVLPLADPGEPLGAVTNLRPQFPRVQWKSRCLWNRWEDKGGNVMCKSSNYQLLLPMLPPSELKFVVIVFLK